jgi:prepilin-type N-terminal cleavage/methylation domain-containing protein
MSKTNYKGFTLIELLVVIAIIGLLSTIIATPIQSARKKARDAKKISEIKAIETALEQYAESNGGYYPTALSALVPTYMAQLPSYAGTSLPVKDRFAYVHYGATTSGLVFEGYHIGVHLETYSLGLDSDRDCTGVTASAATPSGSACAATLATSVTYSYPTYVSGMIGTGTSADFDGTDTSTTTCQAVADCVFDLANSQ